MLLLATTTELAAIKAPFAAVTQIPTPPQTVVLAQLITTTTPLAHVCNLYSLSIEKLSMSQIAMRMPLVMVMELAAWMVHAPAVLLMIPPPTVAHALLTITNIHLAHVCPPPPPLFFQRAFWFRIHSYLLSDCDANTCNNRGSCSNTGSLCNCATVELDASTHCSTCVSNTHDLSSNCTSCAADHYNYPTCSCMFFYIIKLDLAD